MHDPDPSARVAQNLSSYLSNHSVAPADLPGVIESVKCAFGASSMEAASPAADTPITWEPAVPVKRSDTSEAVIRLCCGKSFKSLKRRLETSHDLNARED